MLRCSSVLIEWSAFVPVLIVFSAITSLGLAFSTSNENGHPFRKDCAADDDETYVVEWKMNESKEVSTTNGHQNFNAKVFASSNCWGRRPFLMRGAFNPADLLLMNDNDDNTEDVEDESMYAGQWPTWEEVVDIASDEDSESRIISHIPGDNASFDLNWGPLTEKDVDSWLAKPSSSSPSSEISTEGTNNSTRRRETLVVNDIDRFYPPLADWMYDTFHFLPNWRMDDSQISLAEKGGGIGPHVDNYDVFLIQMKGSRTWQIGRRKLSAIEENNGMIDGLDVRVLDGWNLDNVSEDGKSEVEEWIVHPGDCLYLPPRVAHCGTALSNDSMTLSVGCRAPSVSDLVSKLAERLSSSIDDSAVRRYTDEDLLQQITNGSDRISAGPGEITPDARESAKNLVLESLASLLNDDEWWDEFFGQYVTEQKRLRNNYPVPISDWADDDDEDSKTTIDNVLAGKCVLYQAEGIAFAHSSITSNGRISHRFFVNGQMWQSSVSNSCMVHLFKAVANHRRLDRALLLGVDDDNDGETELSSEALSFLEELVEVGLLYQGDLK